jgi:1-acyl-sn-glycerol-3-phosphate acyltransferase
MRLLRALWRVLRVAAHLLHGMVLMALRFHALPTPGRQALVQWWSAKLLRIAGLRLSVQGAPRPGGALLVANHVSWLDISAIHAACPQARFVSKADVLRWPLLGWLIKGAGTLFIERERKRDALRVVHAMADALQAGQTVAVFPGGTTGPGPALLPFHANLLQAAIATGTPIQPAVLRFSQGPLAFSPAVEFVGDTTLLQSLWRVATARALVAHVQLLPPQASAHADRRALTDTLRAAMAAQLAAAA